MYRFEKTGRPRSEHIEMSIARQAKHCNICGEYKNHDEFPMNGSSRDGRDSKCRPCRNYQESQRQLRKRMTMGYPIKECECGSLMGAKSKFTHCVRCRY